jgi:hypothetical protein
LNLPVTVQPVVQDDDPLGVVVAGVVDNQRCIQAAFELGSDVRVQPVGAGLGGGELVDV